TDDFVEGLGAVLPVERLVFHAASTVPPAGDELHRASPDRPPPQPKAGERHARAGSVPQPKAGGRYRSRSEAQAGVGGRGRGKGSRRKGHRRFISDSQASILEPVTLQPDNPW